LFAKGYGTVNITGSTISGNMATGNDLGFAVVSRGGGMFLYGDDGGTLNVQIQDSTIDDNLSLREGGGLGVRGRENGPVRMTVDNSSISNNDAGVTGVRQGRGGAIFHWANSAPTPGRSELRITNSTLSGNTAVDGSGGVILNTRGAITYFENSTLSDNYSGGNGGAISNVGTGLSAGQLLPQLVVRNSTISGNQAGNNGGGIYSYDGTLEVYQSTLSGNSAVTRGGALYMATFGSYVGTGNEGISTIERSTITANDGVGGGGGVAVNYYHTSSWANSIVSGNTGLAGLEDIDFGANTTVTYTFSQVGGNAMLGPLADNGGPTRTHLPMAGSPVIDAADPTATGVADQRGFEPRVVGSAMDMGSVEVGATAQVNCDFDGNGQCDINDIDLLMMEISSGGTGSMFDLNGDSQVNLLDRDEWLSLAGAANLPCNGPYLLGDFNLDGVVDGSDFGIWNSSKFTNTGRWSQGDANGDGVTDGSDFGIWNGNKFTRSCPILRSPGLENQNLREQPLPNTSWEQTEAAADAKRGVNRRWSRLEERHSTGLLQVRFESASNLGNHQLDVEERSTLKPADLPVAAVQFVPLSASRPVARHSSELGSSTGRQDERKEHDRHSVFAMWESWS
jgi:predicted outer membrane repeat protein